MNRREFLKRFGIGVAVAAAAPVVIPMVVKDLITRPKGPTIDLSKGHFETDPEPYTWKLQGRFRNEHMQSFNNMTASNHLGAIYSKDPKLTARLTEVYGKQSLSELLSKFPAR